MEENRLRFLQSLVEYPEETALAEYKAAVEFDSSSAFGAKLVKHILGQANAGGGYIIVGCAEDAHARLQHDPALNEEIASSYETTRLCQSVDSFLARGQRIDLQIHKIELQGRVYPVISTEGFKGSPFFCGRDFVGPDGRLILKEGAIYVRDRAAKTVVAAGPDQWNTLLKTAVEQRQEEILAQLRTLLEQLGLKLPSSIRGAENRASDVFSVWLERERAEARLNMKQHGIADAGYMEVVHYLERIDRDWNQVDLIQAAEKATCRNTGWPIGVVLRNPEVAPKPLPDGIRASIYSTLAGRSFDFWTLARNGCYLFVRTFAEDLKAEGTRRILWFDTRIWRVAEAFLHCLNLYKQLGVDVGQVVHIQISHYGLGERLLSASQPFRAFTLSGRKSGVNEVTWSRNIALAAIESDLEALVRAVLGDLFMLFEFWQPAEQVWKSLLEEFLRSKV